MQMNTSFREWLSSSHPTLPNRPQPQIKSWKMPKAEIMQYWSALRDQPIQVDPIPRDHKGSTYGMDGIRITGSRKFIDSVVSRLKDFLSYENQHSKLQLIYKQTQYKETQLPNPNSFVFYVQVHERPLPKPKPLKLDAPK
jgi:hypothetical protein